MVFNLVVCAESYVYIGVLNFVHKSLFLSCVCICAYFVLAFVRSVCVLLVTITGVFLRKFGRLLNYIEFFFF
jgi:hypothetical protein